MSLNFNAWDRGMRLFVQVEGDDRWLESVYLGPASDATPRVGRQMFAVDDGESWKLVMATNISGIRTMPRSLRHPS